jgi:hypothetical protein
MTRRHKHLSADQLAEFAVGKLRPRKSARIRAHIAQCEQCTRDSQQLNAIAAMLADASYPPMPESVSVRIASAIGSEARQRPAAMPPTEVGRRDLRARRPRVGAIAGWHLPGLSFRATRLAAVAGAVVIAAAGSYLVAENVSTSVTLSSPSPLAGAAARAQQMSLGPDVTYGQPGPLHTIRAVVSDSNFVAAHLRSEATSAVHAAEAREAFAAQPSASTAALLSATKAVPGGNGPNARRLGGCIGLIAPGQTVLAIDIARYRGRPAAVIVTAATLVRNAEAWVVGSSCSATTTDVLQEVALGSL